MGLFPLSFWVIFTFLPVIWCDELDIAPLDVRNYFPELNNDLTRVSWVHRCNSRARLETALASDVMMIEADIVAGHLVGNVGGPPIPIMEHPPAIVGDLSLEQFLDIVVQQKKTKGIKLDFKSLDVFKASENILEQFLAKAEVNFPVWLNADIVRGPGCPAEKVVVEPKYFLHTCVSKFPLALISSGWAVDASSAESLKYNSTHIDEMTSLLANSNVVHPVTFPVHSGIASNSVNILSNLIHSSVYGASLTLWAGEGEWVDYERLRQLIAAIGKDKVYVDMPQDMTDKLLNPPQQSKGPYITSGALVLLLLGLLQVC